MHVARTARASFLVMVLGVSGCQATGSGTAGGSVASPPASDVMSSSPSASVPMATGVATPAPTFPALDLPPNSQALLRQELPLHAVPTEAAVTRLGAGTEVTLVGGPRDVDGATFYEVRWGSRGGWLRVDDAAALSAVAPVCPPTADGLLAMLAWDRVLCLGNSPVTVTGTVSHCQGGVVLAEPEWLAYACWGVSDGTAGMELHAAPSAGITFPDDIVRARLVGHFDDPAASTCTYHGETVDQPWRAPSAGEQVYLCREAFVVETMEILEVLGTPPLS